MKQQNYYKSQVLLSKDQVKQLLNRTSNWKYQDNYSAEDKEKIKKLLPIFYSANKQILPLRLETLFSVSRIVKEVGNNKRIVQDSPVTIDKVKSLSRERYAYIDLKILGQDLVQKKFSSASDKLKASFYTRYLKDQPIYGGAKINILHLVGFLPVMGSKSTSGFFTGILDALTGELAKKKAQEYYIIQFMQIMNEKDEILAVVFGNPYYNIAFSSFHPVIKMKNNRAQVAFSFPSGNLYPYELKDVGFDAQPQGMVSLLKTLNSDEKIQGQKENIAKAQTEVSDSNIDYLFISNNQFPFSYSSLLLGEKSNNPYHLGSFPNGENLLKGINLLQRPVNALYLSLVTDTDQLQNGLPQNPDNLRWQSKLINFGKQHLMAILITKKEQAKDKLANKSKTNEDYFKREKELSQKPLSDLLTMWNALVAETNTTSSDVDSLGLPGLPPQNSGQPTQPKP